MNRLALAAAREVKARLAAEVPGRVRQVRIFGSMARGEATEDSDLDLYVEVDDRDEGLERAIVRACQQVAGEFGDPFPISPLILAADRFGQLALSGRRIAREILAEGVEV